ncbi:hypothetical protein HMPREF0971_01172 [Segatella oris F0302]|uniref:Uncharacterized protein n=1 Tax=Segatella oris F0302 TaxID=649760 RepID=D1QQC2_9BACT|nr:hypothetical protein HMPREF0971_01172 [Segatella oris F0302]
MPRVSNQFSLSYCKDRNKEINLKANKQKIGCHHDNRFSKTNYLKTNLLKQIKKYLSRI